jgi:hypothetical protein
VRHFPDALRAGAQPVLLRCLEGIEAFYAEVDKTYESGARQFRVTPESTRTSWAYIGETLWFLFGTYAAKYRELVGGTISAVADQQFLQFALCGRALIETTAMLRYHQERILAVAAGAKNPDSFSPEETAKLVSVVDIHARGGRFNWVDFYSSNRKDMAERLVAARKSKKDAPVEMSNPTQTSVLTAIDSWAKAESWIMLSYDFFCELVHPNLGSALLMMGAEGGALHVGGGTAKSVGQSLCVEGIKLLAPVLRQAAAEMAKLIYFAGSAEPSKASHPSH